MNTEESVTITLELDPSLASYHKRAAANTGVSIEVSVLEFIRKYSEVEREQRRHEIDKILADMNDLGRTVGIPPGAAPLDPHYEFDPEDE